MINISNLAVSNGTAINYPIVFIANGLGVGLMLVVLLSRHKQTKFASLDGRLFMYMCQLSLALCVIETVGYVLDGRKFIGAHTVITIVNSLLFILFSILACLWLCYIDYKLFGSLDRLRRIYPFVCIPAIIVCIMGVLNMFIDVFFYIDADNHYIRKPLCVLPFILALIYMAYGALLAFKYRKRRDRYIFMTVIVYIIPVCLGIIIQFVYYGISLIWVATSFGIMSLYINLQHEFYYIDPLTGLYNRRYLYDHMEHLKFQKRRRPWIHISGLIMDINNFKSINDTYGHIEGDMVLRKVGKLLYGIVGGSGVAVRYGGDEFVIMLEDAYTQTRQHICKQINQGLAELNVRDQLPYEVSLAIGLAELDTTDTEEFFRDMDRHMYENKRVFYQQSDTVAPNDQYTHNA